MSHKILKDIRYYESDKPNVEGQSMPGNLGRIFHPTSDTHFIGQRIARKLNELKYAFGEYDHIYINLTTVVSENEIQVSNRNTDKRVKFIDLGVNPTRFNALTDDEKDICITASTINILKSISNGHNEDLLNEMERQLLQFHTELSIHYKTKETSAYKIDIYYQIAPRNSFTKAIIEYRNKKTNDFCSTNFKLHFYDDVYSLIDTVTVKDNKIILQPKKSFRADLYNNKYKTPMIFDLKDFEKCGKQQ